MRKMRSREQISEAVLSGIGPGGTAEVNAMRSNAMILAAILEALLDIRDLLITDSATAAEFHEMMEQIAKEQG